MSAPLLSARDVETAYDGRVVARLERLDVAAGEVVALIGPNGSGKSTLLRTLALIEPPSAGTIAVCGVERPRGGSPLDALRRCVTLALPAPWLFAGTVLRNVEAALAAHGVARDERRARAHRALSVLDVDNLAARDAKRLSSGESARVGLARALALETPVLLLDEPFAHLDPDVLPTAVAAVEARRAAGAAIVVAALAEADLGGLAARAIAPGDV